MHLHPFLPNQPETRKFFKYEFGYINIDSKNIYLTNSGNWSETDGMEEKPLGPLKQNRFRKWWIIVWLLIGATFFVFVHSVQLIHGDILAVVAITASFIPLYKYMRNEIGPRFRIPIKKIIAIEDLNGDLLVRFKNSVYEEDSVLINSPRGLIKEYLETLIGPNNS